MQRRGLMIMALALGLVVAGGSSLAGTIEIPISGTSTATTIDPGVQWTDADGVHHYRDLIQTAVIVAQDVDGTPITGTALYVVDINIDLVTGDGDTNIEGTLEITYGDMSGTLEGRSTGTISGFLVDGAFNYPRGGGDFVGWHYRGDWTHVFGSGLSQSEGFLQNPGGNKSGSVDAASWSSVKALYR